MCNPALLAGSSLAIGAAGAVSKYAAAQADAAAQATANSQQAYSAEVARNQKWDAINTRQIQEGDAAQQALFDNSIRALKAADSAQVAGGEAGVAGNSVESVARDFYRQQGRIDATTIRNTDMRVDQLQDEKKQAEAERIGRSTFAPVRAPSLVGLGLEIGGSAVNAYDLYDRRRNRDK